MKGGIGEIFKQAQELKDKMETAKRHLEDVEVTGRSGAGLVEVVMTCSNDVKKVKISDELLSGDKEVLEDLVAAAINDAVKKIEAESKQYFGQMATGMMPSGMKWPGI